MLRIALRRPRRILIHHQWVGLAFAVTMTASIGGCRSTHYSPSDLPAELHAQPRPSVNQLHLSGFTPSGSGSEVLGPDDLVEVTITSGLDDDKVKPYALRVSEAGMIDAPFVGKVRVEGIEPTEAGQRIAAAAVERGIYRRPQVTVEVKQKATNKVVVLGAVASPGAHTLPRSGSDIVSALAAAGGLTEDADPIVEVLHQSRRSVLAERSPDNHEGEVQPASFDAPQPPLAAATTDKQIRKINLASQDQLPSAQRRLGDRDVVLVHPREKDVIHVGGLVKHPDQYELPLDKRLHLLDALAIAGGRTSVIADSVLIIRRRPTGGEPVVIQASVKKAKLQAADNLVLAPGDLVSVESSFGTVVANAAKSFFNVSLGVTSRAVAF